MRTLVLAATATALVAAAPFAFAGDKVVKVSHDGFNPEKITIEAGDSITFVNQVNMPGGHTLKADDGSFESPPLATPGAKWSHTFSKAGTLGYSIEEHAWAKGMIIVK